jgi:hypothetical protein
MACVRLVAPLNMGRRLPRVIILIKRFLGFPDGEGQVEELAHGVADVVHWTDKVGFPSDDFIY